jgi:diadenosine tetraphosphate (Ap4A) HIT family hydrolase
VVEHCIGPLGVGTLIVKPKRHVVHVWELTDGETVELGPLLARTATALVEFIDADQVYTCLWSHMGGVPVHIHFVVQPVTRAQMDDLGVFGPMLQVTMFDREESPPEPEVEAFADRARVWFSRAS